MVKIIWTPSSHSLLRSPTLQNATSSPMQSCTCVEDIFKTYDYNNVGIKDNILRNHNKKDNAWIAIDKDVYSIRKDDNMLLEVFKNFYGQNVKDYILTNNLFSNIKNRILILEKLKDRKIGYLMSS